MNKFAEIRYALARLNDAERKEIIAWLERCTERLYGADRVEEPKAAYLAPFVDYMTREEFLEFQERSPISYEYVNGVIRAMSGPSVAHCLISQNIFLALQSHLRGKPCQPFCTGMQVNLTLGKDEIVYEPDVSVSCDRSAWDKKWIPNPKLVVEVLSPSTQHVDRREKAVNYRRVVSLDEYVMASQKRPELTILRRAEHWQPDVVIGPRAVAEFRSLDLSVPLADIYEGIFSGTTPSDTDALGV
jgi:Uma2 family endonuclease